MSSDKYILDACCGGKMFWFDKHHPNVIYQDIRKESKGFIRLRPSYEVSPDILGDFRSMPYFEDRQFSLIVLDPPHILKGGLTGWMVKKYGRLNAASWQLDIKQGLKECWRTLDYKGTLVFKWNETNIPLKEILKLVPAKPLFGDREGRKNQTIWLIFSKPPKESGVLGVGVVKEEGKK